MIACCVLCCKMLRFSLTNVTVCIMCDSRSKTWSITWTSASTRLLSWRLSRCRNISRRSSRSWCRLVTRCSLWRKTLEMWVKRRWTPPRFHRPFSISIGKKRVPPQFRSCLFQKRTLVIYGTGYNFWKCILSFIQQHESTHTLNYLMALCPWLFGWASTRRNLHPLTPRRKKKDLCGEQGPLSGSLSPILCFEPETVLRQIKPAYNQSRPDCWLKSTASALNWLIENPGFAQTRENRLLFYRQNVEGRNVVEVFKWPLFLVSHLLDILTLSFSMFLNLIVNSQEWNNYAMLYSK